MKILVALNHPAHYYVFKYTVINLKLLGHEVKYVIKEKDILEKLLISEKVEYIKINEKRQRSPNVFSVISNGIIELIKQDLNLLKLVLKWHPKIMIGTDIAIAHVGFLMRIPSYIFNEDDFEINKLFCKSSYPFAFKIVAPNICSVGKYEYKKISYNGFQKMSYLHPEYFHPDIEEIKNIIGGYDKYFIIRLVSLTSGHDIEGKHIGMSENLIDKLITLLDKYGRVFINNEGSLNSKYERYRLNIVPNKMHHLLAFATMMIGDSQTMCAEAGLLGTPFIRFNDFVGKISYLKELEEKYKLGYGVKTNHPEKVIDIAKKILQIDNVKEVWCQRRLFVFNDKLDVTRFYTDLIVHELNKI